MAKVNVNLNEAWTAPANVLVMATSVLPLGQQTISGGRGTLPGVATQRTNGLGVAQFTLQTGRFLLTAQSASGGPQMSVSIDVPDTTLTYEWEDILTPGTSVWFSPLPPSGASPAATMTVPGLIRITKNGTTPIAAVGVWHVNDVAALKGISSDASNTYATLIKRQVGEPKYFYWDNASAAADDPVGFTVVKPTDNPANGRWIQDT